MESKKLIEVTENGKKILVGEGRDSEIKVPVEISFIVDKSSYDKLERSADYYKWNLRQVLTFFCDHADMLISEMEAIAQGIVQYQEEPWINK